MLHIMNENDEIDVLATLEKLVGYIESENKGDVLLGANLMETQFRKYFESQIQSLEVQLQDAKDVAEIVKEDMRTLRRVFRKYAQ